ncbi:MAG: sdhC [Gemmatimonadetes bacterium]|nr:sdhC [Gemmatimonadota bacterium]
MHRLAAFWESSVGKKAVMAVTGIVGVLFVIGHMVGNLQVFQGAERLNAYGHLLHGPLNELIWGARVVLLVAVVLHMVAAWQLTMRSRAARPVPYAVRTPQVSTLASRTLRWGGVLLLAFLVYHLLDLTIGAVNPAFEEGNVYGNLLGSLQRPLIAVFYIVAMGALALHLYHGAWSSLRTLGVAPESPSPLKRRVAVAIAVIVAVGFAVVPVAVILGIVR